MRKTEMTIDIPVQMLAGSIFYAFIQFYKFCRLGGHVNPDISGDTIGTVGKPFDQVCVL